MQGQDKGQVQESSVYGRLNLGAVRLHDRHLQGGFRKAVGCPVCEEGLDGAIAKVEMRRPVDKPDGLAKSDGTDEGGDSAPPRGDRPDTGREEDKVLEW